MIQAMYNSVSGLRAHKQEMDVIANNIANVNTVGFKSSRATFKEMLSETLRGATAPKANSAGGSVGGTNPVQVGLGTTIGSIDSNMTQGSLLATGKPTDVAIEGNGFLMLGDGVGKYYTRDGAFQLDAEGNVVAAGSGLKVLGWSADPTTGIIDDTQPITPSTGLKLQVGHLAMARQTSEMAFSGNLNSSTPAGEIYATGAQIYDSLGTRHNLNIKFTKLGGPGQWFWEATSPDQAVGSTAGNGTISFGADGRCLTGSGSAVLTLANANGAVNPLRVALDFSPMKQLSGDATASPTSQDGLSLGVLASFSVGKDGVVSGMFTNGLTQKLAKIALAQFSNPAGLARSGNNQLTETSNSGLPQIGQPGAGSLGAIAAGFLESSNVDLPTEFANMIVAQRGFQANSRVITTSDELLQELVQLKR